MGLTTAPPIVFILEEKQPYGTSETDQMLGRWLAETALVLASRNVTSARK